MEQGTGGIGYGWNRVEQCRTEYGWNRVGGIGYGWNRVRVA